MIALDDAPAVLAAAGLVEGLASKEVRARLVTARRLSDCGRRALAFYLTEMEDRRLYQDTCHNGAAHYAEDRLDLDRRRAAELIRLGRLLRQLPRIDVAFCQGRLSWSRLELIGRVVSPEHEEAWLERALNSRTQELKLAVRLAKTGGPPREKGDGLGTPRPRYSVRTTVGATTHRKVELAQQKLSDEAGRPVTLEELLDAAAELLLTSAPDADLPGRKRLSQSLYQIVVHEDAQGNLELDTPEGRIPIDDEGIRERAERIVLRADPHATAPLPPGVKDRPTPPETRHQTLARDGKRCQNCGSHHDLHVHHIEWRCHGGRTTITLLVVLCKRCHGLVHEGLLIVKTDNANLGVRFFDRDGREVGVGTRDEVVDPRLILPRADDVGSRPPALPEGLAPLDEGACPLDAVPATVDAAWWRQNAHRLRLRAEKGLELRPGDPLPDAAPMAKPRAAPAPVSREEAFAGVLGQEDRVASLAVSAAGSRERGLPFPHTLFAGPAGTGKTTLARGIARLSGSRLHETSGPLLPDVAALLRLLACLGDGDVLFVDEIHAVPRPVLEVLYAAMNERRVPLVLHAGVRSRTVSLSLPPFTLLAATTEDGDLPAPLLSRFGRQEHLDFLSEATLAGCATARAAAEGVTLAPEAAKQIAAAARGTPREARRLVDRALEAAAAEGVRTLGPILVARVLARLGYDERGLGALEQRVVAVLEARRRPIPLARLASLVGTSLARLARDVEPWLLRRGLLLVTPRGRTLGPLAATDGG